MLAGTGGGSWGGSISLGTKLLGNLGSALVGRIAGALIGVITFSVLARSIGADGLGHYRTVLTMLLFTGVLFDFGLYSITLREISRESGDEPRILGNAAALRIFATICAVLFLLLVLLMTDYDATVRYGVLIAGAGWIGYQLNDVLRAVFQLKLAKHRGAIAETVGALVALLLVTRLAALDAGTAAMLGATAVGFICTAGLAWYYADRLVSLRLKVELPVWRALIVAGLPVAGSVLLLNVQLRIDVLLLSIIHDAKQVGLYDAPLKLYELLFVIPYLFGGMMMPLFIRDRGDGSGSFGPRLSAAVSASIIISSLAFAVLFVHAESIVTLLAGEEFADSATPLRILAAAALFAGISAILRFAATALHQPGKMLHVDIIGVSAALLAHAILIPPYGIVGAALGKLCGDIVTSTAAIVMLRKQFTRAIFNSVLVAVAGGMALFVALSLADYTGLHWMMAITLCLPVIGGALLLVPHVRRDLSYLAA
ncbi:MAG: polysaccharide biosynthesis protein [Gammaproteobacteria bacterium]|nr:polysaccharide biosynthesis protein [Gammaproteobacteria bacterium]